MSAVQVLRQAGETRIVFGSVLNIAGARQLYDELSGSLARAKSLVLDAAAVEQVDAAGMQLLAAFCRAARDAGRPLRWHAASPSVRDAAIVLDLSAALGEPR